MTAIGTYAYQVELAEPLSAARERVIGALKEQGFGVLTEIDVQATLREKIGAETAPYRILGVCNPVLAHQALTASPHAGLMLPCTVTLREEAGRTIVEVLRPDAALSVVGVDELRPTAAEAERRLLLVAEALKQIAVRT
jgi:uncharacterized protein (DUF302 family)